MEIFTPSPIKQLANKIILHLLSNPYSLFMWCSGERWQSWLIYCETVLYTNKKATLTEGLWSVALFQDSYCWFHSESHMHWIRGWVTVSLDCSFILLYITSLYYLKFRTVDSIIHSLVFLGVSEYLPDLMKKNIFETHFCLHEVWY